MSNQKYKLGEAEYFYGQMMMKYESNQNDEFLYCLSAFLSAARSIIQYTDNFAGNKRYRRHKYNKLVGKNKILSYFKEKRNINIHECPISYMTAINIKEICFHTTSSVSINVTVGDSNGKSLPLRSTTTSIVELENDVAGETITLEEKKQSKGFDYRFTDWSGEEDVIELSRKYLEQLSIFIVNAKRAKLIV
jgi:hypothetical protein